ncbi:MAG: hypothetical protein ABFE08_00820 [Armatimonadia bacterium]
MTIPGFSEQSLAKEWLERGVDEAFQELAASLLREDFPSLHAYPAGGKDGGIDLCGVFDNGGQVFVQCKHLGENGAKAALAAWGKDAERLGTHIADPDGPTKGQAQYGPWYDTKNPVRQYRLCVSSIAKNRDQTDEIRDTIEAFFVNLATEHPHLAHLGAVEVVVDDWADLTARLERRPDLLFRFFPETRPRSLVPIEAHKTVGTFRSYLEDAKLPYYSRSAHARAYPPPQGITIPQERALIDRLASDDLTGLIVTGAGGIGKTRLALELALQAHGEGWLVLFAPHQLRYEDITYLGETPLVGTRVLVLLDYVETQSEFAQCVQRMSELNDALEFQLRFVASCRKTYYSKIQSLDGQLEVPLSPVGSPGWAAWEEDYQHHAVRHILTATGVPLGDHELRLCRDVPILAVFLAYLLKSKRTEAFQQLLAEEDFGRWVLRRLEMTFPGRRLERELALLLPQFPLSDSIGMRLSADQRDVLDHLATDGWVEKMTAGDAAAADVWEVAHDVLADQAVLSYISGIPHTLEEWVRDVLQTAESLGTLPSALVSLQRIASLLPGPVRWSALIEERISRAFEQWQTVRNLLTWTSLLSVGEALSLLDKFPRLWEGAEADTDFQNRLGWFARIATRDDPDVVTEEQQAVLKAWIARAAPYCTACNFMLNWGLRLAPQELRPWVLDAITKHPDQHQTHFPIATWLRTELPPEEIQGAVSAWLGSFATANRASFVYAGWLNAGGDKVAVQKHMEKWLAEHETALGASFVYQGWLDAGGDTAFVQEHIEQWLPLHQRALEEASFVYKAWLEATEDTVFVRDHIEMWLGEHETALEARFVYRAWLNSGGDPNLVRDSVRAWLRAHGLELEADYVLSSWARRLGEWAELKEFAIVWLARHKTEAVASYVVKYLAREDELPEQCVRDILEWCRIFADQEDVITRFTRLRKHLWRPELADDVVTTAETLLGAIIDRSEVPAALDNEQAMAALNWLIGNRALRNGPLAHRVDALLVRWLRFPHSYGPVVATAFLQHHSTVRRVCNAIGRGELNVVADRGALERFLQWVNGWTPKNRVGIVQTLDYARRHYPAEGLWEIVQVPHLERSDDASSPEDAAQEETG